MLENRMSEQDRRKMAWTWALRPSEFGVSLVFLAILMLSVTTALALEGNGPKALRVALASVAYLGVLVAGGMRFKEGRRPPFVRFMIAGAVAGLVSGLVRPVITVSVVAVQTVAAAFVIGGFHWWAVGAWRRLHEGVAASKKSLLHTRLAQLGRELGDMKWGRTLGPKLPFPEERVLEAARAYLESRGWKLGEVQVRSDVPLRVGHCVAHRRAADNVLIGYHVTILIDPTLGVPCDAPHSEPRWGSSTIFGFMLDENGEIPHFEVLS